MSSTKTYCAVLAANLTTLLILLAIFIAPYIGWDVIIGVAKAFFTFSSV